MDSSRYCGIYEIYQKHSVHFNLQQNTMIAYTVATDLVVAFSLYVIKTSTVELLRAYRALMYCNIAFPAVLCNTLCLIFVPYIILPYPVILTLGPLRFGKESTLIYCAVVCWSGAFSCLSILYTIILNYITVCHSWMMRSSWFSLFKWLAVLAPQIVLIALSILLPYLLLTDTTSYTLILEADAMNAEFITKFSALVVYLQYIGVDMCLIILFVIYSGASLLCCGMIIR